MPNVNVPADFFRSELRIYADWREAFARELLQNSVDAGATTVEVTVTGDGAGTRVRFADDGHGMDRRTLEEVFFALGRTTKGDGDVGGFGRARIITCFAQRAYTITTGTMLVHGSGGDYEVTELDVPQRGCVFEIDMVDTSVEQLRSAVRRVVSRSTVPTVVRLDGNLLEATRLPGRAVRVLRDEAGTPWAKVYLLRDQVGELRVQVGGIPMFSRYLPGWDDVLVEVAVAHSREVLAASRDNLRDPYRAQLDQFSTDLLRNRHRTLREVRTAIEEHVDGGGFHLSAAPMGEHTTDAGLTWQEGHGADLVTGRPVTVSLSRAATAASVAVTGTVDQRQRWTGGDVYLSAPAPGRGTAAVVRAWDPRRWTDGAEPSKRRLLAAWEAACAVAVDALVCSHPEVGSVAWAPGFLFDEGVRAGHRRVGGGHVLFLNPEPGRRWNLGDRSQRRDLLARALHEAAHIAVDGHDEAYAGVLTDLYAALDPQVADRAVADARRNRHA